MKRTTIVTTSTNDTNSDQTPNDSGSAKKRKFIKTNEPKREKIAKACSNADVIVVDSCCLPSADNSKEKHPNETGQNVPSKSGLNEKLFVNVILQQDDFFQQTIQYGIEHYISKQIKHPSTFFVHDFQNILPIIHCHQTDTWSCGYRNLQMMLAMTLPQLPNDHSYFSINPSISKNSKSNSVITIPSISHIQTNMEESWEQGFDPEGAKHYRRMIHRTRKKIGAVDVASLCSFWFLDVTVLQFVGTVGSSENIARFVWTYFSSNAIATSRCSKDVHHTNFTSDSYSIAISCLSQDEFQLKTNSVSRTQTNGQTNDLHGKFLFPLSTKKTIISNQKKNKVLPLFLQWNGHSVTIIGVEKYNDRMNLLILDPKKNMSNVMKKVEARKRQLNTLTTSSNTTEAGDLILKALRKNVKSLEGLDCQIVLPSTQPLEDTQRMKHQYCVRTIQVGSS